MRDMLLKSGPNFYAAASQTQQGLACASHSAGLALARRYATAVIGLVVLTGAVACSSPSHTGAGATVPPVLTGGKGSATPASSGPAASGRISALVKKDTIHGLISFKGYLILTGAHYSSASFTAFPGVRSPASSCARIGATGTPVAKSRPKRFAIPAPPFGGSITIAAQIQPYHGPGAYRQDSLVKATALITVGSDTYKLTGSGASVSVRVAADGSGTFIFSKAAPEQQGAAALSGSIRWTCSV